MSRKPVVAVLVAGVAACVPPGFDPYAPEAGEPDAAFDPGGAGGAVGAVPDLAVYRLVDGDTLSSVAARFAVPGGWPALARTNLIVDPHHVEAGRGLLIPTGGLVARGADPFAPAEGLELEPWRPVEAAGEIDAVSCASRHHELVGWGDARRIGIDPPIARCADVAGREVCATIELDGAWDGSDDGPRVAITVDGAAWLRVPMGWPEHVDLIEADLDRDGRDELLIYDHLATSNGIALDTIALGVTTGPGQPVHWLETNGWSLESEPDGCTLWETNLVGIDDPWAGHGNYMVDRRLRWTGQRLVTAGDRVHAARLAPVPPEWRGDPLLDGVRLDVVAATVVAFADGVDGDAALTLDVAGQTRRVEPGEWWSGDDDPDGYYRRLAWLGEGLVLPARFRPPAASVVGHRAWLETRLVIGNGHTYQVVWIDPRAPAAP